MGLFAAIKRTFRTSTKNEVDASEPDSQQLEKHVFPEQLQKVPSPEPVEEPSEKEEEPVAATPSVVVPWVVREVAEYKGKDKFEWKVHMKVHAKRLLDCWLEYEDQFPKTFAQILVRFVASLHGDYFHYEKVPRLACFLETLFDGGDSPIHIVNNAQELWPPVLEEIGHIHLTRGKEWTSTASSRSREETTALLNSMADKHARNTGGIGH